MCPNFLFYFIFLPIYQFEEVLEASSVSLESLIRTEKAMSGLFAQACRQLCLTVSSLVLTHVEEAAEVMVSLMEAPASGKASQEACGSFPKWASSCIHTFAGCGHLWLWICPVALTWLLTLTCRWRTRAQPRLKIVGCWPILQAWPP